MLNMSKSEVYRKLGQKVAEGKARKATLGEVIDTMEYGEIAVQIIPEDFRVDQEPCLYVFYDEDGLLKSGQGNFPIITCVEETDYYIINLRDI